MLLILVGCQHNSSFIINYKKDTIYFQITLTRDSFTRLTANFFNKWGNFVRFALLRVWFRVPFLIIHWKPSSVIGGVVLFLRCNWLDLLDFFLNTISVLPYYIERPWWFACKYLYSYDFSIFWFYPQTCTWPLCDCSECLQCNGS